MFKSIFIIFFLSKNVNFFLFFYVSLSNNFEWIYSKPVIDKLKGFENNYNNPIIIAKLGKAVEKIKIIRVYIMHYLI